jgi:predicted lipid-binding transport protein (Tim44 family)
VDFMIILLAMVAAFLGLRLYSVLGKRTGAEQEPMVKPLEKSHIPNAPRAAPPPLDFTGAPTQGSSPIATGAESGLRAIASADRNFDIASFLNGSQAAYKMVLEAYWSGDKDTLADLTDDAINASFGEAIDARVEAGESLENRLIRIEEARIVGAAMDGSEAQITVRFVSDVAALVRNKDGDIIAGSMSDAAEEIDTWTFARDTRATDPNWRLIDTDAE